jgi:hypothetical protein
MPFILNICSTSSMTSSGCSVNDFSRSYNSTALLTSRSGIFVLIAFPMRARSWYFSFLSFVITSDVALGGVITEDVVEVLLL